MTLLQVKELNKYNGDDQVVRAVSFSQPLLHKLAIAGETGSGKSTLLKMIAGLVQPDGGIIFFNNEKVIGPDEKLVAGHEGIAYLSQHFELPKSLRVEQVLTYANLLSDADAETIYEVCHIAHLLKRRTDQLSGGEKQRVALARLLTGSPDLLLLDEPFSNLDRIHKSILQSTIDSLGEKLNITVILVSHDPADTLSWADKIIVMKAGEVIQEAAPSVIYYQPLNEYVAGLFGRYNRVSQKQSNALGNTSAILRPEDLTLVSEGIKARVVRTWFYGGHVETEVKCLDGNLLVRSAESILRPGDDVCVLLSPAYIARTNSK